MNSTYTCIMCTLRILIIAFLLSKKNIKIEAKLHAFGASPRTVAEASCFLLLAFFFVQTEIEARAACFWCLTKAVREASYFLLLGFFHTFSETNSKRKMDLNMHSSKLANPLKRSFHDMATHNSVQSVSSFPELKNFKPRSYQCKLYEIAMRRNTIGVLRTGTGKTMIAVMLIKEIGDSMKMTGQKKLIIFLAPTVNLVHQQYKVIKEYIKLEVEEYYGDKNVDEWNAQRWEEEIKKHDILVMTPQILLDALRKAFLTIEMLCLMVLDECHRATGNHPYAKIMKEFYHKSGNKPKIFGMTASPVTKKGVSSIIDCEAQLSGLESILDSQIYTIEDRTEVEVFVPSAIEICKFYDSNLYVYSDLIEKLNSSCSKFDALLTKEQELHPSHYKDMDDIVKALRKRLSNDHAKILYCLEDLGLICSHEAVKVCLENAPNNKEECHLYRESYSQCTNYLKEVLSIIEESLPHDTECFLDIGYDYSKALKMGYLSSKLHKLIQIFQSFGGARQVMCLIFVDRIITAKVIERFMKKVACLSHFTVSYLTGSTSSVGALAHKVQKENLELFRSGKVNLLFSTDVVEEGIHVPNCSCVIRFDLPKTVRSYVQSRGRARQSDSQFVTMLERGNERQRDQLFDIIRSERSMINTSLSRGPNACLLRPCIIDETYEYHVDATGASVTPDSSVSLIQQYCGKLPGDKYFTPKPIFQFSLLEGSYMCRLTLPPNAAFKTIDGPISRNSHLSKQLVCFEACKRLHKMGALDDRLLPFTEEPSQDDVMGQKESASGAGTTKRKELHGMTCARALHGSWGDKLDGVVLEAYRIDFSCNIVGEHYAGFVLLVESKLDEEVGNASMVLYMLANKLVKSSVSPCGRLQMDSEQIIKAKCYQELFLNGVFGRLYIGSEESREFLLQKENKSLWNPSNMYLILPLESSGDSINEACRIDWTAINSCATVVEFLKKNSPSSSYSSNSDGTNIIKLANNSFKRENLKDMVVLATHTGRLYSVLDVLTDTSAESPFDGNTDPKFSRFLTFGNYFQEKYGIVLSYPRQPLLLLKQSHNPHNLLKNFNDEGASSDGRTSEADHKMVTEKAQVHVRMPPEVLVGIDIPLNVLKSFYLLPSLMHRLESLMLASQLREEIACHSSNSNISSSLILEALTTLRCCESFSMERLELLGDSVLKYVVSCDLFLKYPKKHEGQLSAQRSRAIRNSTLHKLGTDHKLQVYIRDGAFEARRWVGPGQHPRFPVPCECGVDTPELPLDHKFHKDDPNIVVGKHCDRGHRWMGSKTISDCVEALVGAYYVGGGLIAAIRLMNWFGIVAELDPTLVHEAIKSASEREYIHKIDAIKSIESKIGYEFCVKGLLLEAITHASEQELGANFCYQRLEFLGDSVLDLLITRHLYQTHTDVDPGALTDLRSESVNNENFAQVAVRNNIHQYLQHCSGLLLSQINEYVKYLSGSEETIDNKKGPKALGDLVESIVGALLIDTKLSLEEIWRIIKPLLCPIVTPDTLHLAPQRQLNELCDSLGYFLKEICTTVEEGVHAELKLQLKDDLLIGQGCGRNKKFARGQAAAHLLRQLRVRGITYSRFDSKRRKQDLNDGDDSSPMGRNDEISGKQISHKKQRTSSAQESIEPTTTPSLTNDIPVIEPINMKKGGPRTALYELCKKLQWKLPDFKSTEKKSRSEITFGEGSETRTGFSIFVSEITLHIPNHGFICLTGDQRADKKSSYDSAAFFMLHELQRKGRLVIKDNSCSANKSGEVIAI